MSIASYSAGKKVYNGGSNAATRGTVDPMGYINRELNKVAAPIKTSAQLETERKMREYAKLKNGGKTPQQMATEAKMRAQGPSQSRSGLASTALNRLPSRTTTGPGMPTPAPVGSPVSFSPTGQIIPTYRPPTPVQSLPYDAGFNDDSQSLLENLTQNQNNLTKQKSDLEREYTVDRSTVEKQLPDMLRNVLNSFSGRGLAFSSAYGNKVGETQNEVANTISQIESNRARSNSDIEGMQANLQSGYQTALSKAQQAAARRSAEQAGSLNMANEQAAQQDYMAQIAQMLQQQPQVTQPQMPTADPAPDIASAAFNRTQVAPTYTPNATQQRGLSTFPTWAQQQLRSGQTVTAGDGRVFQMINGHAVDINSSSGKAGLALRQFNKR